MLFRPNVTALLFAQDHFDKFGVRNWATVGVTVPCAVIKLDPTMKKSPIRDTESASRSAADEEIDPAVILFPANVTVALGDKIVIYGKSLLCCGSRPYISLGGVLDFYECSFEAE